MAELSYLGKLLGLPHVLDPTFHEAYNSLFGTPQPAAIGEGSIKVETNPLFVQKSNVSRPSLIWGKEVFHLVVVVVVVVL